MGYDNILFDVTDSVGIITINIPERYNPIDIDVEMEILDAFREVEENDAIKAALITGAGDKAFSAGADIKPYLEMNLVKSFGYLKKLHDAIVLLKEIYQQDLQDIIKDVGIGIIYGNVVE